MNEPENALGVALPPDAAALRPSLSWSRQTRVKT